MECCTSVSKILTYKLLLKQVAEKRTVVTAAVVRQIVLSIRRSYIFTLILKEVNLFIYKFTPESLI